MQDFDVYLNELYEVLRNMCAIHVVRPISWRLVEGTIEQAYHMCQIMYGISVVRLSICRIGIRRHDVRVVQQFPSRGFNR